jgi:MoxR-like ATPase
VLEGKPFMLKKKGELIYPAPGFTVFATANTKGKGSEDGRYMFTNVLNEAFLERFRNTYEQEFPPAKTEKKIIQKELASVGREDDELLGQATFVNPENLAEALQNEPTIYGTKVLENHDATKIAAQTLGA